jgi:hypothetical protein
MKNYKLMLLTIVILLSITCERKNDHSGPTLNCEILKNGIINTDNTIIITEISKLTTDLSPDLSANDPFGHADNFDILLTRINECQGITAELTCYACIKTLPPISEILIKTDSSGIQIQRSIDIKTSELSTLEILGIHQ